VVTRKPAAESSPNGVSTTSGRRRRRGTRPALGGTENEVDLILIDLVMPAMSGTDLATFLKKRGLTRRLSSSFMRRTTPRGRGSARATNGRLGAISKDR